MRRNWAITALLLGPAALLAALFFVYPIFGVLKLSVHDGTSYTLAPLQQLYQSRLAVVVLQRTFVLALSVTALCLLVGYPAAYFMAGLKPRTRAFVTYLILLPFWISILIRTYTWVVLLGREGLVNKACWRSAWSNGPFRSFIPALPSISAWCRSCCRSSS